MRQACVDEARPIIFSRPLLERQRTIGVQEDVLARHQTQSPQINNPRNSDESDRGEKRRGPARLPCLTSLTNLIILGAVKSVFNVYELKAHLSKIIEKVRSTGEPITVCKNGEAVVDIVPHRARDPLRQNPELAGARFIGDPTASVAEEDWPDSLR